MTDTYRPLLGMILAGGLSRRLNGVPKAGLMVDGQTLLARTVDALAGMLATQAAVTCVTTASGGGTAQAAIAVVGPADNVSQWLATSALAERVTIVQEDPPFSGPAAGIAAGLDALPQAGTHVLIVACDMPRAADLARELAVAWARCAPGEGVMAVTQGRKQPLAAIYPLTELRAAVAAARAAHRLENASVFSIVASVNMKECAVAAELTADIDTWADATAHGISGGPASTKE